MISAPKMSVFELTTSFILHINYLCFIELFRCRDYRCLLHYNPYSFRFMTELCIYWDGQ